MFEATVLFLKKKNQKDFRAAVCASGSAILLYDGLLWFIRNSGLMQLISIGPLFLINQFNRRQGYPAGSGDAPASQKVFSVPFVHKRNSTLKPEQYE
ncbi:hypothetical protein, partial [Rikenella microfusus]